MKNPVATITHYLALTAEIARLQAEADAMKPELIDYVATSEKTVKTEKSDVLTLGQYTLTVGHRTRAGFDEKRLRAERPDIVAEYGRVTSYDTFSAR